MISVSLEMSWRVVELYCVVTLRTIVCAVVAIDERHRMLTELLFSYGIVQAVILVLIRFFRCVRVSVDGAVLFAPPHIFIG